MQRASMRDTNNMLDVAIEILISTSTFQDASRKGAIQNFDFEPLEIRSPDSSYSSSQRASRRALRRVALP
jgi:hypothetical protein